MKDKSSHIEYTVRVTFRNGATGHEDELLIKLDTGKIPKLMKQALANRLCEDEYTHGVHGWFFETELAMPEVALAVFLDYMLAGKKQARNKFTSDMHVALNIWALEYANTLKNDKDRVCRSYFETWLKFDKLKREYEKSLEIIKRERARLNKGAISKEAFERILELEQDRVYRNFQKALQTSAKRFERLQEQATSTHATKTEKTDEEIAIAKANALRQVGKQGYGVTCPRKWYSNRWQITANY